MLVSIDPGKYATKAVSSNSRIYFPTRLSPNPIIEPSGNSHIIIFDSDAYIIGEQAEQLCFEVSKTNLVHKLATYTAISKLQEERRVQLVIGCPLSIYKNPYLKAEYKSFIMDRGDISIVIDGNQHSFFIENILVLPEGTGVVYVYPSFFKNRRVAVIDLGGLNFNFCIYDNFIPQVTSMFTQNHGGYDLQNSILKALNSKFALSLNPQDIPHVIRQGGLRIMGQIDKESSAIVSNVILEYILQIIQEIQRNNFNLDTLDVCFVGGTSKTLKQKLKESIPHAFIPDEPEWVNCTGFYEIGKIKYGKTA